MPGLNEYINDERANRFKAAMLKRNTQQIIEEELIKQIKVGNLHRHENPCELEIHWVEGNNRRDGDNISFATKFLQDSMVNVGIFPDDSRKYIKELHHTFETQKDYWAVSVTIKEIK